MKERRGNERDIFWGFRFDQLYTGFKMSFDPRTGHPLHCPGLLLRLLPLHKLESDVWIAFIEGGLMIERSTIYFFDDDILPKHDNRFKLFR